MGKRRRRRKRMDGTMGIRWRIRVPFPPPGERDRAGAEPLYSLDSKLHANLHGSSLTFEFYWLSGCLSVSIYPPSLHKNITLYSWLVQ